MFQILFSFRIIRQDENYEELEILRRENNTYIDSSLGVLDKSLKFRLQHGLDNIEDFDPEEESYDISNFQSPIKKKKFSTSDVYSVKKSKTNSVENENTTIEERLTRARSRSRDESRIDLIKGSRSSRVTRTTEHSSTKSNLFKSLDNSSNCSKKKDETAHFDCELGRVTTRSRSRSHNSSSSTRGHNDNKSLYPRKIRKNSEYSQSKPSVDQNLSVDHNRSAYESDRDVYRTEARLDNKAVCKSTKDIPDFLFFDDNVITDKAVSNSKNRKNVPSEIKLVNDNLISKEDLYLNVIPNILSTALSDKSHHNQNNLPELPEDPSSRPVASTNSNPLQTCAEKQKLNLKPVPTTCKEKQKENSKPLQTSVKKQKGNSKPLQTIVEKQKENPKPLQTIVENQMENSEPLQPCVGKRKEISNNSAFDEGSVSASSFVSEKFSAKQSSHPSIFNFYGTKPFKNLDKQSIGSDSNVDEGFTEKTNRSLSQCKNMSSQHVVNPQIIKSSSNNSTNEVFSPHRPSKLRKIIKSPELKNKYALRSSTRNRNKIDKVPKWPKVTICPKVSDSGGVLCKIDDAHHSTRILEKNYNVEVMGKGSGKYGKSYNNKNVIAKNKPMQISVQKHKKNLKPLQTIVENQKENSKPLQTIAEKQKENSKPLQTIVEKQKENLKPLQTIAEKQKENSKPLQTCVEKQKENSKPIQTIVEKEKDNSKPLQTRVEKQKENPNPLQPRIGKQMENSNNFSFDERFVSTSAFVKEQFSTEQLSSSSTLKFEGSKRFKNLDKQSISNDSKVDESFTEKTNRLLSQCKMMSNQHVVDPQILELSSNNSTKKVFSPHRPSKLRKIIESPELRDKCALRASRRKRNDSENVSSKKLKKSTYDVNVSNISEKVSSELNGKSDIRDNLEVKSRQVNEIHPCNALSNVPDSLSDNYFERKDNYINNSCDTDNVFKCRKVSVSDESSEKNDNMEALQKVSSTSVKSKSFHLASDSLSRSIKIFERKHTVIALENCESCPSRKSESDDIKYFSFISDSSFMSDESFETDENLEASEIMHSKLQKITSLSSVSDYLFSCNECFEENKDLKVMENVHIRPSKPDKSKYFSLISNSSSTSSESLEKNDRKDTKEVPGKSDKSKSFSLLYNSSFMSSESLEENVKVKDSEILPGKSSNVKSVSFLSNSSSMINESLEKNDDIKVIEKGPGKYCKSYIDKKVISTNKIIMAPDSSAHVKNVSSILRTSVKRKSFSLIANSSDSSDDDSIIEMRNTRHKSDAPFSFPKWDADISILNTRRAEMDSTVDVMELLGM